MMNCIIPLVMIRTNSLHYRKRRTVILNCTVLTMLITNLVTIYILMILLDEHVTNAITYLKSEKDDNFEGLSSDNFKNDTH